MKNVSNSDYEPYICVVYSINSDFYSKTVHDREVREHGNSKQKRPYHRTCPTILKRHDTILSANQPPKEVYNLLDESGGPMQSNSMSQKPQNLKQMRNRQSAIRKSLLQSTNETISQLADDHLPSLLRAQGNSDSFLKTVTVTDHWYIAFTYIEKQLSDIEKFCCKSTEAGVSRVDAIFNLCNLWITDTSYRNKHLVNTTDGGTPAHVAPIMLQLHTCREIVVWNYELEKVGKIKALALQ